MKKSILFPILGLMMAGCVNESVNEITPDQNEEGTRSFISVSLVTPYSSTRATNPTEAPGSYVDGYDYENKVNSIRFYFFNEEGIPTDVFKQSSSGTYLPYIDWQPTDADVSDDDPDVDDTVEKVITATLGINQPAGADRPELVLAVINPPAPVLSYQGNPTLTQLRNILSDFYTGLHYNNFVITNSVYVAKDGGNAYATEISEENFGDSADDPDMQTLVIYVERVLARLDFYLNIKNASKTVTPTTGEPYLIYQVSNPESNPTIDGNNDEAVYARFLGWNITQTPDTSRLVKEINAEWPDNLFQTNNEPWSVYQYHRSYWAINPPEADFNYLYGTFDGSAKGDNGQYATALSFPENGATTPITEYMQENAAEEGNPTGKGAINPTQVIIAAQLVNAEGQPVELVRWANRYYTQTNALVAIANVLDLWKGSEVATGTQYTHITPADLQLVSATELYGTSLPEDVAEYYVYVQLSDAAAKLQWHDGSETTSNTLTTEQVNNYIQDRVNHLMVWTSGQAYYYIDIRHISNTESAPGYFGVVRNHIYSCHITSIEGLGTPVFKPEEVIHPQQPSYDDSMITAEVKILQWRIVSQDYDIKW